MQRMKWLWLGIFSLVTATYWFSLNPVERSMELWALRKSLLYYSGIVAMAMMSLGMILSLRLRPLEELTGGLDRNYRLHKWVGITGVAFAALHWFIKVEPKALVRQGWLSAQTFETPKSAVGFFDQPNALNALKEIAKTAGEWSIYALIALALIALIPKIPYRTFFRSHRIMAMIYLILVFHSVVLFGKLGWNNPVGWLMAVLMLLGSAAAIVALTGRIAASKRFDGVLVSHVEHTDDRVTQVEIRINGPWPGHQTGQFAFLTFDQHEGAHPFSIASGQNPENVVRFYIKQLGDYTRTLAKTLNLGQKVTIEGPYGRFSFEPSSARQVWIAGGVGVTPFISRLEYLAHQQSQRAQVLSADQDSSAQIVFFLCVRSDQGPIVERVRSLSESAGVNLHVISSDQGKSLTANLIMQTVPEWNQAHFWFCGPGPMGVQLRKKLVVAGLPDSRFHQELFDMR